MTVTELKALAGRILHPDRPRLAEARLAVEGLRAAEEAWSRLIHAGLVPESWRADPGRNFWSHCEACGGGYVIIEDPSDRTGPDVCSTCGGRGIVEGPHPPTVRGCVTVASGVEGMVAAEALAHHIALAFGPQRGRVTWSLTKQDGILHGTGWMQDVREALALRTARARKKTWNALHSKLFDKLQPTFGSATGYVAEIEGLRQLWGEQQPNPFETVLELLTTGYVLLGGPLHGGPRPGGIRDEILIVAPLIDG